MGLTLGRGDGQCGEGEAGNAGNRSMELGRGGDGVEDAGGDSAGPESIPCARREREARRTSPGFLIRAGRTGGDESELDNHTGRVDAREGERIVRSGIRGRFGERGGRESRWEESKVHLTSRGGERHGARTGPSAAWACRHGYREEKKKRKTKHPCLSFSGNAKRDRAF